MEQTKCETCKIEIYNLLNTFGNYCSVHCAIEGLIKRVEKLENENKTRR